MDQKARERGNWGVEGVKDVQTKSEEEMARWRELHRHATLLACVQAPQKSADCHMVNAAVGSVFMLPSRSFQQRH